MLKREYLHKNYHLSILNLSCTTDALEYCLVIEMGYLISVKKSILYKSLPFKYKCITCIQYSSVNIIYE